jgi:hypothetical protein
MTAAKETAMQPKDSSAYQDGFKAGLVVSGVVVGCTMVVVLLFSLHTLL